MNNYNIFIAASPLQLLNCIEAAFYFKTNNNILLFLTNNETNNFSQMSMLLDIFKWSEVKYVSLPKTITSRIFFVKSIQSTLKDLNHSLIEKIFVGEYRSDHITHITNYLRGKEIYLVDDGMALLNYREYASKKSNKQKLRALVYKSFLYKLSVINFKFFTTFDIGLDNIVKNEYAYIKQYMKKKSTDTSVYFIGQPLIELSMISEHNYKVELNKVINLYKNKKFVYILHRRQEDKIIKKLALELDFEYKRFDQLIELEILNASIIPSEFATFYSTAIITLPKFFNNCIYKAYKINPLIFNKKFTDIDAIEKCYIEFSNSDIQVVSL